MPGSCRRRRCSLAYPPATYAETSPLARWSCVATLKAQNQKEGSSRNPELYVCTRKDQPPKTSYTVAISSRSVPPSQHGIVMCASLSVTANSLYMLPDEIMPAPGLICDWSGKSLTLLRFCVFPRKRRRPCAVAADSSRQVIACGSRWFGWYLLPLSSNSPLLSVI